MYELFVKPDAPRLAHAWFIESAFVQEVGMCVSVSRTLIRIHMTGL